jgi:hypothetical protein
MDVGACRAHRLAVVPRGSHVLQAPPSVATRLALSQLASELALRAHPVLDGSTMVLLRHTLPLQGLSPAKLGLETLAPPHPLSLARVDVDISVHCPAFALSDGSTYLSRASALLPPTPPRHVSSSSSLRALSEAATDTPRGTSATSEHHLSAPAPQTSAASLSSHSSADEDMRPLLAASHAPGVVRSDLACRLFRPELCVRHFWAAPLCADAFSPQCVRRA